MGKTRRANTISNNKAVDTTEPALHREPTHHDDHEITYSTFPFAELIPNWAIFDVQWKNARTMSRIHSTHHGKGGGKKLSDFKTFHSACCLDFIDITISERVYRVRCMNDFIVDSDQCTEHKNVSYKDGPNSIYTWMKRNQPANWGIIRDTGLISNAVQRPRCEQGRGATGALVSTPSEKDVENIARIAALEQKLKNKNPNQRGKTGGLKTGTQSHKGGTKGIQA